MDWRLQAARRVAGLLEPQDMPDLAVQALLEGDDSESLVLLAGAVRPDAHEALPLFDAVLAERGIAQPDKAGAALRVALQVATEILAGSLAPDEGGRRLFELLTGLHPVPKDLAPFAGLWSELDDFGDRVRLDYYGEDHCAKVRADARRRIIEAASVILERARTRPR